MSVVGFTHEGRHIEAACHGPPADRAPTLVLLAPPPEEATPALLEFLRGIRGTDG